MKSKTALAMKILFLNFFMVAIASADKIQNVSLYCDNVIINEYMGEGDVDSGGFIIDINSKSVSLYDSLLFDGTYMVVKNPPGHIRDLIAVGKRSGGPSDGHKIKVSIDRYTGSIWIMELSPAGIIGSSTRAECSPKTKIF